ncbi:MAG TPA: signal peptidase II [Nannocystis sp.]
MAPPPAPSRGSRIALASAVAGLSLALDLWTKAWVWEHLREQPAWRLVPGWLDFDFACNPGSAFGFLNSVDWARYFFIAVTLLAVGYLVHLVRTLPTQGRAIFVAIGLIAGGALGNLHDRLIRFHDGAYCVVDFIVVHLWGGRTWPAFNVADAVLVAGVALFLLVLPRQDPPAS